MGSLWGLFSLRLMAFFKKFVESAQGLFYHDVCRTSIECYIHSAMVPDLALCVCYTHRANRGMAGRFFSLSALVCWQR